jgi:hypothetical protein
VDRYIPGLLALWQFVPRKEEREVVTAIIDSDVRDRIRFIIFGDNSMAKTEATVYSCFTAASRPREHEVVNFLDGWQPQHLVRIEILE